MRVFKSWKMDAYIRIHFPIPSTHPHTDLWRVPPNMVVCCCLRVVLLLFSSGLAQILLSKGVGHMDSTTNVVGQHINSSSSTWITLLLLGLHYFCCGFHY